MKDQLISKWEKKGINPKIIKAFKSVPRENFIDTNPISKAYLDQPLSIGNGQTISQPTTVMIMTQILDPKKNENILEIGTGSGYQAAIIAKIIEPTVLTTTEIISQLAKQAKNNLKTSGISNVNVIHTDGGIGYKQNAPYDKIIITAACPKIPQPLVKQLKQEGSIIAPVGDLTYGQEMIKAKKVDGKLKKESLGRFVFVPLKGEYGF
ncbi:MAG: Protein-L-isoaspartate O-methyltransferase [Candidatus Woesearchaeota archaeon]|nr:Protein-L-isoaspartate O-methyltransferase [Candidatus Woesearchaeota archaeon]